MSAVRNANLYISGQLHRWLWWLAEINSKDGEIKTPDSLAEEMLRRAILTDVPNIEEAEANYWRGRRGLDAEAMRAIRNYGAPDLNDPY